MSWMSNYDTSSMPYIVGPAWSANAALVKAEMDKFMANFTQLQYAPNAGMWDCDVWVDKPTWMACPGRTTKTTTTTIITNEHRRRRNFIGDGPFLACCTNGCNVDCACCTGCNSGCDCGCAAETTATTTIAGTVAPGVPAPGVASNAGRV